VTCLVLDCSAIGFVDSQGLAELGEIAGIAEEEGVTLRLARVKAAVRAALERDGLLARIPSERIHDSVDQAVRAQGAAPPEERPGP
jgi:SulP family sulfate permease